jgi:hypothetical protein
MGGDRQTRDGFEMPSGRIDAVQVRARG